jgi:CheY-like chemotaxis protein
MGGKTVVMPKILIIDDQPEIRELIRAALEIGPYQLFTAENGRQGLDIALTQQPDIILLDLKMPGSRLDGHAVCQKLRQNPATARVYIIIVSASGQKIDIESAIAAGANDFLTKPFNLGLLLDKVETALVACK